jgi:iron complex outermembrane receptor protein
MGLLIAWLCAPAAELPGSKEQVEFRINAPTMVAALIQFSQQAELQLVFPTDGASGIAAPKVEGSLTPRAALEQLLKDSGLTFQFVNARTVSVVPKAAQPETRAAVPANAHPPNTLR